MNRATYLVRAREFTPRGQDAPHARLTDADVHAIRSAQVQRDNLRRYIRDELSNAALAQKFGVSVRAVERVTMRETWSHL